MSASCRKKCSFVKEESLTPLFNRLRIKVILRLHTPLALMIDLMVPVYLETFFFIPSGDKVADSILEVSSLQSFLPDKQMQVGLTLA